MFIPKNIIYFFNFAINSNFITISCSDVNRTLRDKLPN